MGMTLRSYLPKIVKIAGVVSILAVAFTATLPTHAKAQDSCEAVITIASPGAPMAIGATRTVTFSLGVASPIIGGTKVTINQVRYDLDCDGDQPLVLPCTDQGNVMNYQGDATITTTCGTCMAGDLNAGATCAPVGPGGGCDAIISGDNAGTCVAVIWSSNVPAGGHTTNEIVFTPSVPIDILDGFNPYCDISFTIKLNSLEPTSGALSDATQSDVEVTAGFTGSDAVCDNNVASPGAVSATIPLMGAPQCGDGILQTQNGETCDPPDSIPMTPAGNVNRCRTDCTYCGDGILNGPETCDTGGVPNRACNSNCTGRIAKDPGSIIFGAGGTDAAPTDRLQINGLIMPPTPIDITKTMSITVTLTNANGVIYSNVLPANLMLPVGRKFKYRNRDAKSDPAGGFAEFQFSPHKDGYRIKLVTYGNLSAATLADMTIEVDFDTAQYTHSATWSQTRRGNWREVDHSN